jgi:hypothetical protein
MSQESTEISPTVKMTDNTLMRYWDKMPSGVNITNIPGISGTSFKK